MHPEEIISAARGEVRADLVIKNAKIVNVFTGELTGGDVAVAQGRIAGIGSGYEGRETLDAGGKYLAPGFMDAHVHIESSMVSVPEYARAVIPRGTTSVVIDPHEIANVLGPAGVQYMLDSSRDLPLDVFVMVPSCVPATHLETSGAALSAADISSFFGKTGVLGLAEMMNFPGVLFKDPGVMSKLRAASGRVIDGHAPGLSGKDLCAYVAAGIRSDHECTTAAEALEKISLGMTVFVREGTAAKNLEALVPAIHVKNAGQFAFCTDDRHPADLLSEGHIAFLVKKAIGLGLDPVLAVRMATLNPARYYGFNDRGAVAPGYRADLVLFDGFGEMNVDMVLKNGKVVSRKGSASGWTGQAAGPSPHTSVHVKPLNEDGFRIEVRGTRRIRVIEVVPGQIVTGQAEAGAPAIGGFLESDVERDLLKLAVVERHRATGNIGLGFARGFGLKKGALASSVAHDSHNIIVVGTDDGDMLAAVRAVTGSGGGLAVVDGQETLAFLPLPIAGLMSDQPLETVRDQIEGLKKASRSLGCTLEDPFMQLSFLALPVIPELKLTDRGLVDVGKFDFVPLAAG